MYPVTTDWLDSDAERRDSRSRAERGNEAIYWHSISLCVLCG